MPSEKLCISYLNKYQTSNWVVEVKQWSGIIDNSFKSWSNALYKKKIIKHQWLHIAIFLKSDNLRAANNTSMQEPKNTWKISSSTLHFKMLLTFNALNKFSVVEDDDPRVSDTDWQELVLISGFFSIPRISNVLKASYFSSKLVT